jgi:hypothetical protein
MKKRIALALLSLGLVSSSAQAYPWFYAPAQVAVQPHQVVAIVWNTSAYPVLCQGRVIGRTAWGGVIFNTLPPVVVPVALSATVGVAAPWNDPFVAGWAEMYCRY